MLSRQAYLKKVGGFGFRDLNIFNKAMLAKRAWGLMCTPHSLALRVLQGIYFPNNHFLKAKSHWLSCWSWKSICYGKEVLLEERG